METFRDQIDRIDAEIMILLRRRFQILKKVAKFKVENNMPIYQPERERDMLENKAERAKLMGMDQSFIKTLFEVILDESKKYQERLIKNLNK